MTLLLCLTCNTSVSEGFPWIRFIRKFNATDKNTEIERHSPVRKGRSLVLSASVG